MKYLVYFSRFKKCLYLVIFGLLAIGLSFLLSISLTIAQEIPLHPVRVYRIGDWVTYKNCNYPTSLTKGPEYVYFGTSGGVIPYHHYGRYWQEPYTVSDGMAGDFVTAVLYDENTNYLWAAHEDGLSYLTPNADRWINISNEDLHLPEYTPINRLGSDRNSIWVMAAGGFLFTVNKIVGFFQSMEPDVSDDVIWSLSSFDLLPRFSDYVIDGQYEFMKRGSIMGYEFREFPISVFLVDESLDIYGGAWGLGLLEGDENIRRLKIHSFGPLQNHLNALVFSENALWVGSNKSNSNPVFDRSGISKFYLSDGSWEYFENRFIHNLATDEIQDIAYMNNNLWVGTTEGVTIFNTKRNTWKRISDSKGLRDNFITTIAVEDSIAWIGTPLGLNVITIPDFDVRTVNLSSRLLMKIYKIAIGPERVWVATDNGLYAILKSTHMVEHYDVFGDRIPLNETVVSAYTAIATSDSVVVFGRSQGLIKFSIPTGEWKYLPQIGILNEVFLYDIALSGEYLWLGTSGGAILVRLSDFYFERYTTMDGLAGNSIYKIVVDGDWVWFATDQGLTKYHWRLYASANK